MVSLFNGMTTFMDEDESSPGSGSSLPSTILILAGLSTGFSVAVSIVSVHSHLKNYLKPALQRCVHWLGQPDSLLTHALVWSFESW